MARHSLSTSNALTRKVWEKKLMAEVPVEQFWGKFSDTTGNNIVHVKKDLTAGRGDNLTFGIRMRNPMSPIVDGRLKGNEQKLATYSDSVSLHSYKLGYADDGELSRHRAAYDVREEMFMALKENAIEAVEDKIFEAAYAASHTNVIYPSTGVSGATENISTATLTAAGKLTAAMVARLFTLAQTGSHRTFIPLKPLVVKGRRYFILLVHPDVVLDFSQDSTMQQANREAMERGLDNPLFTEADLIYRNILIYGHEKVPIYTNGGAGGNIPYSTGLLLGAQAILQADGMPPKIVEDMDDYDDAIGMGWHVIAGWKRPSFNSKTFGSIQVVTARTNVTIA